MHRRRPFHALLASALVLIVIGAMTSLTFAQDSGEDPPPDGTPTPEASGDGGPATGEGWPEVGPDFEVADCAFPVEESGTPVDCGYLTVPADRSAPDEGNIRLHVALMHSLQEEAEGPPVVILAGGPGESLLEQMEMGLPFIIPYLFTSDVILFDQRGVGFSEPAPECPEMDEANLDALEEDPSDEEMLQAALDAIAACKDRLTSEGIDLSIFSTSESAADLEALRESLGYEQWDLYGVSYGTRLALTAMREFPDGIRSVILDAPYPLEVNLFTETPANADRAFSKLFDACANDAGCSEAYPGLESTFHDVVSRLNDEPITIEVLDPASGEVIEGTIDGADFTAFVFQALYSTGLIPLLPSIIVQADQGEFGTVSALASRVLTVQQIISMPMHVAVQCREDVSFTTAQEIASASDDYPYLQPLFVNPAQSGTSAVEVCDIWDAGAADESWKEAVTSDIPTLIFSGEFDPITPPSWAEQVHDNLPNSHLFVFPNVGHGALLTETCASELAFLFLEDPSTPPDSFCVDELSGPTFEQPIGDIVMVPFENPELGISGVVPEGWIEAAPGVWTRSEAGLVTLSQQPLPGVSADEALSSISTIVGLDAAPEPIGTCCGGELEWDLYEIEIAGLPASLAITEVDGTTYLISLEGIATAWDRLADEVFRPAVEAFMPLEPSEEAPLGGISMVPFIVDEQGYSGLAPEGWTEFGPGAYSPSDESRLVLLHDVFPGTTQSEWIETIVGDFGADISVEQTGACCDGELQWDLYLVHGFDVNFAFALTEVDGNVYVVSIQGTEAQWQRLYDEVYLPAVEGFKVGEGSPGGGTPDDGSNGETPPEGTPPGDSPFDHTIDIWWPTDGTDVSGIAPIHAQLEGHDLDEYDMFWQVDGAQLVPMWDHLDHPTPHKKAYIDYHQWDWSPDDDLYDIEVVAMAPDGRELGRGKVTIRHPAP